MDQKFLSQKVLNAFSRQGVRGKEGEVSVRESGHE